MKIMIYCIIIFIIFIFRINFYPNNFSIIDFFKNFTINIFIFNFQNFTFNDYKKCYYLLNTDKNIFLRYFN